MPMDEDLIVREIIKSLAFEIEAVNEDNVLRWTTTNGTPLSVKVRVRNTDEPRLIQRGPIPAPRIGITAPDRLRLVSSDQTILSFNVYLEDESAKQEEYKRRSIFKIFNIGGCLGTCSDDDGPYLPSSSNQKAIGSKSSSLSDSAILDDKVAQTYDAKNAVAPRVGTKNGIFGKCKPGGCLDPPFDEDRYPYALSKAGGPEKLKLEIHELEDKQQADNKPGEPVNQPFAKEKYLNAQDDQEQELVSEHNVLKKQTDITYTASVQSRIKTQEGSIEYRTSAQITIKDEDNSKKVMDIYARNSIENSVASNYSNSLITYHTDTSSTESLYEPIPNKKTSIKSYNESQRQTYEYPESYFVPPKDFLRQKEEERRYSKEPSNYQICASSNVKVNNITETEEQKIIYQNSRSSKDTNMKKIELTLSELQPNDIDVAQKSKVKSSYKIPDIKESESNILTGSKNVDGHVTVPIKITTVDSKNIIRQPEAELLQLQEPFRSGNDDVYTIETNSDIAIKISATEKIDYNVLRSGKMNKPMNYPTSTLSASNNAIQSAVVKKKVQKSDETLNSYPYKEPSNYQIGPNSKIKVNNMIDTNAIKAEMVEDNPVSPKEIGSKDINIKKIELTLSELQSNDNEIRQKVNQDKVTPVSLSPDDEEHASNIFTYNDNEDDHINVSDTITKGDYNTKFKPKISRSGDIDIANMEVNSDLENKIWSPEIMDKNILRSGEISKHTKPLTSPSIDSNINVLSEIITPNGRILDEMPNSYPNTSEHNISPSLGISDYPGKKVLVYNKDNEHIENPILRESRSNLISVAGSPYLETVVKENLNKNRKTDIYTIQSHDRETAKTSAQSEVLDSSHAQKENSQYRGKDLNKRLSGESEDLDHKAIRDKNISGIPVQQIVVNQQKSSKQDLESTEQLAQEQDTSNISDVSKYDQYFAEKIDNNNNDNTIQFGRLVVPDEKIKAKKESIMTKDKPNIVNITKTKEKYSQNPDNYDQNEKNKRDGKDLTPYSESNYENKEFDVSSIHSIDFIREHRGNDEINDGIDTLGKSGKLNSVIIQKDFLRDSDIKLSPESTEKLASAILQKTLFVPKGESDINKDEINKSISLKRNTFTIIASDTSLQKHDEIEETPEEVTNIHIKAIDYNVVPSQTQAKTEMLDRMSKKPENNIHSSSNVEPTEKTTQENETKINSKNTDSTKLIAIDQAHNKTETLNKSTNDPENERNLILTRNQTDVLDKMLENKMDGGIDSVQKTDSKSVSTHNSPEKIMILNTKYPEFENKRYSDTRMELPTNMPVNTTDTKLAGERTGLLSDQNHSEIVSFGIDNIEMESKMYNGSGIDKTISDTNITNSSETEYTSKEEYYDQKHDVTSVSSLQKPIQNLYSKNTNYDTSAPFIQIREKIEDLTSKKTEGDKSTLTSENYEKLGYIDKMQENNIYSQTATTKKSIPENVEVLQSKIISDDKLVPVLQHGSGLDLSEKSLKENVKDLYANITEDDKLAKNIQNSDKAEILENKVMEKKTSYAHAQNAPTDTTQTLIPQNEINSHFDSMNHDKLASDDPRGDEIKLDISYKEPIHKNYIDSIISENQEDLLAMTDKNSTKTELEDVKYKNLDSVMYNDSVQEEHAQIADDDKYVLVGQTDPENIHADQQQIKITRENSKQMDNIFSVTTFDKTSTDIPIFNNEVQKQIEFTQNISPEINDKTKIISEINPPFSEYSGLTRENSGNKLEKHMEEKNLTQTKGSESTIERDTDLIKLNTEVKQDESVDKKKSYIAKDHVPIMSATSKLDDYSYETAKNTLVNKSISKLKVETDRDAINKAVKETFETVKYMSKPSNIDRNDESFNKKSNVSEKHRAYQLSKLPVPTKYSIEMTREDFDTISSTKIGGEETSTKYRQFIIPKQKDKSPPNHQVMRDDRSQIQSGTSYLDMSFYSYINNNNQRVVQTYNPAIEQQRRNEATVTVVKTVIRHGNEIRIPVDKEYDLSLNIVDKQNKFSNRSSNIGSPLRYLHRETHGIDRAKKQDVLSKNLALIYESGLIPLHNVIKDLTQQVNILTTKQEILQEQKRSTKRTKSLRLIPIAKRCGCKRI